MLILGWRKSVAMSPPFSVGRGENHTPIGKGGYFRKGSRALKNVAEAESVDYQPYSSAKLGSVQDAMGRARHKLAYRWSANPSEESFRVFLYALGRDQTPIKLDIAILGVPPSAPSSAHLRALPP